jgi:signal transduction histidine kinase
LGITQGKARKFHPVSGSTLMTSSGDLSLPAAESIYPTTAQSDVQSDGAQLDGFSMADAETVLVFTQDRSGQYLSFYWPEASQYGLKPEQIIDQSKDQTDQFGPIAKAFYLERLHQVLDSACPTQFACPFRAGEQYLEFALTLSPVLVPQGPATLVVATGQFLGSISEAWALELADCLSQQGAKQRNFAPNNARQQFIALAQKIRQTLDLDLIWQQAVTGLGELLGASSGLFCTCLLDQNLSVGAEFAPQAGLSLVGTAFPPTAEINQALATLKPVLTPSPGPNTPTQLLLPTVDQGQPNGLIVLYFDHARIEPASLIGLEVGLEELAEQIGTGIAQAQLLEESYVITAELQKINERLMRHQSDLEEARQQAEAASRLKSEFLANTSHELRTPLNGIIGFLKLVVEGMADDPEEQAEFIEEAHRSALDLFNLINDILDIAKIEAGKMQLDLNPIQLDDLLLDVENFTRPQAQQKQLSFEIRTPDTRDEVILYANYQRLKQVMLNLISNAIKFTHEGSITISAEVIPGRVVVQEEEKPGTVKISVADTGIGVSLDKQDKLFQSFSQVDGSRTRQYGGTGLGLAISQKLVEAMGGVVNFFSMGEGLGSTVTFTVPLYQDPVMVRVPLGDSADLLL